MLGTGVQFIKCRNGGDQFYSPARGQRGGDLVSGAQRHAASRRSRLDELSPEKSESVAPDSPAALGISSSCNLERFLEAVTPSVPAQYSSKMTAREWETCNLDFQPFFVLSDLWVSFKEWSAYGTGVPVILNDSDTVFQYYVPYLSGIQLYSDLTKSTTKLRPLGEESDSESFRDSCSDRSNDSERDTCGLLSSDHHMAFQEGFSGDEGECGSSQNHLLFEYFERDQPYCREPLADKLFDLARQFPELKTLKSCDLFPSSWISVAWYPIYRIPTGPTLKDLDACFLTFHSLHTPLTGREVPHPLKMTVPLASDDTPRISLPAFGLASYKYKRTLWTPNAGHQQLANSLLQSADDWLNLLRVNHPDFCFFCRR